jgi:hypothetical protein
MTFDYASQGGWVHDNENLNDIGYDDDCDSQVSESWCDRNIRISYYPESGRDRLYLHILANELGISTRVNWDYIDRCLEV